MELYRDGEYKLDSFFENRRELMKKLPQIKNEYDYEKMFLKYYKMLKDEKYDGFRLPTRINIGQDIEYFDKQIFMPNEAYYKVVWFIDVLKQQIKEYGIEPVTVPIDILFDASNTNCIDSTCLESAAQNNEPIIVGIFPCVEPPIIVIDGNHRVIGKKLAGHTEIEVYMMFPQQLVDTIQSEYIRKVAIMHNNIVSMINYMVGIWSREIFEASLLKV